jgi:hypothetical protein
MRSGPNGFSVLPYSHSAIAIVTESPLWQQTRFCPDSVGCLSFLIGISHSERWSTRWRPLRISKTFLQLMRPQGKHYRFFPQLWFSVHNLTPLGFSVLFFFLATLLARPPHLDTVEFFEEFTASMGLEPNVSPKKQTLYVADSKRLFTSSSTDW